jgi:hypothetical protein
MKTKLLNALKQGYKKLGLADSAFERVATFGETFITSDEQIQNFVTMAEPLLKAEQSAADRVRTELNSRIKELEGEKESLEAKLKESHAGEQNQESQNANEDNATESVSDIIAKAISEAIKPLSEELSAFKLSQSQKSAVEALDSLKATWDYAKGYPSESEDAYERVMELYEVSGKKWTAEELTSKFKEKFNKAVAKKGVDTSKPFESTQNSEDIPDFSKELEMLKNDGVITE